MKLLMIIYCSITLLHCSIDTKQKQEALSYAVKKNDLTNVKELLEAGINPDMTIMSTAEFKAPIIVNAIRTGNIDMVKLFIKHKAILNNLDEGEWSVLKHAVHYGDCKIVKLLLDSGADPNYQKTNNYITSVPLVTSALNGNLECTKLLIEFGAQINIVDSDGDSPLDSAVFSKNIKIINLLLVHGADVDLKLKNNQTPLSLAKRNSTKEIVELLEKWQAKNKQ